MSTFGDPDSAGAIFIFKNDSTETEALILAAEVAAKHHIADIYSPEDKARLVRALGYDPTDATGRFVYVVHSAKKQEFLTLLSEWHQRTQQNDAALLIYAHMGEDDIGPVEDVNEPGVTWIELADAIPNAVSSLWLAGCESRYCINAWARPPARHPVKNWLVCTRSSIHWTPLLPYFTKELSVSPIFMPEAIASELDKVFNGQATMLQWKGRWVAVPLSVPSAT